VLPFAAFLSAQDRGLTADVKLPAGCSSPALHNARLTLMPSMEKPPQGRRKAVNVKKNTELARSALSAGHRLLEAHQYEEAAQQFEIGLSYDERNWLAYLGLGVAEMRRGNVHKAMSSMERSRDLAKAQRQDDASIYYNIACGYSRLGNKEAALGSLAMAIKRGFALPEAMSADPDLKTLANEGEFKKLLNKAVELKTKQAQTAKRGGEGNL
jgi:tetratricopeptide (TPR) repeat protein